MEDRLKISEHRVSTQWTQQPSLAIIHIQLSVTSWQVYTESGRDSQ